ncbi:MAG TPA: EamA family transporter, partial [Thermoanaerobaculia bacterium]|nr:EamA family transporter [Thermoanaerobaculia bacterium]
MTEPVSRPAAPAPAPAFRVHLTLFLVQLSFGGFHVVAKALLAHLTPLALAAIRVGFATPVLLALAWQRDRVLPSRRDLPILALLGALGVVRYAKSRGIRVGPGRGSAAGSCVAYCLRIVDIDPIR